MNVTDVIHPGNLQCFLDCYYQNLLKARREYPKDYAWPDSEMSVVFNRMTKAIKVGSFNKDSHAFKWTCKELKINHTYKAIREFISL
jgi:hypothetical protein